MQARFRVGARRCCQNTSVRNLSFQFVFDVRTDNIIEAGLRLKSEVTSTFRIELFGPAGNDALNKFIRRTADTRDDLVAGDAAQCFDLLSDRARYARHREIDALSELLACQSRSMDEKSDGRARACMRMPHGVRDGQERFLPRQRFADNSREETGCRLVWFARAHANGRQPDTDAVKESAPRVVSEQQFANCLLSPVGGQRREMKVIGNGSGKRRTENGD